MAMGIHDEIRHVRKSSDVESIVIVSGYRFGLRNNNGRVQARLPKKPDMPIAIARAIGMYKYPVQKRLAKSCWIRRCRPCPRDCHWASAAAFKPA
jgi:hypothetical protein